MNTALLINGQLKQTKQKKKVINPSTQEAFAEVCWAEEAEIEEVIIAARAAVTSGVWRNLSFDARKECLLKISEGILAHAAELAQLETANTGKPIKETTFMDIPSASKTFAYFAEHAQEYLQKDRLQLTEPAQASINFQAHGVAVLIVPWNYPLLIASWKLSQALAAGNTVILKPSSLTPLTALALGQIIHDAGLPEGVVNIINADAEMFGLRVCSDPRVDMISFTGSNEVGKKIFGYSSAHPKKMLMELGGKSASIILEDTDVELAVNASLCSIFLNQGQMCTAMSRILVHKKLYETFLKEFSQKAGRIKIGPGDDYQTQMGPLISEKQRAQVICYVAQAVNQGAKLIHGGKIPEGEQFKKGFFFEPTVLGNVSEKMGIFHEEVFGPVACVSSFSDEKEAIALANATRYGLAASIWSSDSNRAERLAQELDAGIVWINTYGMFYNEVPYGGCKASGFGRELGREGLLEYGQSRSIVVDRTEGAKPLVNYWYGF